MKRIMLGLLSGLFFLTACAGTPPLTQPTVASVSKTSTPTITITPLPTIPTFTPTFDVSTIVTVTPAPKAECPKVNPSVRAKFATPNNDGSYEIYYEPEILDYLNSGGSLEGLQGTGLDKIADLTGDSINEVGYGGFIISYSILGCKDGQYHSFLKFSGDSGAGLGDIIDLNKNGIPEVILYNVVHYGFADVSIFEWDGSKFNSLINMGRYSLDYPDVIDWVSATEYPMFMDIDKDGLQEVVLVFFRPCGGFGDFCDGTPRRQETTILAWNGQNYVVQQNYYTPAQYRFQAIQDGDAASSQKEYDKAINLYQEAVSSGILKSYSLEISDNLRVQYDTQYGTTPTPTPLPLDPTEYPRLAAYAYYRIMLLQLVQNQETEATTTYNTLKQEFGDDSYARPYVEMASAFWEAYQSTHKMYDGCAAAIQYAVEHPDILTPLGSEYHGSQSHTYVPTDVCPFR